MPGKERKQPFDVQLGGRVPSARHAPRGANTPIDTSVLRTPAEMIEVGENLSKRLDLQERAAFWASQVTILRESLPPERFDNLMGLLLAYYENQAETDELTGLKTKIGIMKGFHRMISHAERTREKISMAILDVDHFKDVNDRFGHPNGNKVLAAVARHLHSGHAVDIRGRWGGEEFMEVLLATDTAGAVEALERRRQSIHNNVRREISTQHSLDLGRDITVSVGIATFDPEEYETKFGNRELQLQRIINNLMQGFDFSTIEDIPATYEKYQELAEIIRKQEIFAYLEEKADQALYAAKARGRNRTVALLEDPLVDGIEPDTDDFYVDFADGNTYHRNVGRSSGKPTYKYIRA